MRSYLAALAALAAAAVPSSPAVATHDLTPFCSLMTSTETREACLTATAYNTAFTLCRGNAVYFPDLFFVVFTGGGNAYFPQSVEIRTVCHQDAGPGTAYYELTAPGPVAAVVPSVRGVTVKDGTICTRWDILMKPGNTWGLPSDRFVSSETYCYELTDIG